MSNEFPYEQTNQVTEFDPLEPVKELKPLRDLQTIHTLSTASPDVAGKAYELEHWKGVPYRMTMDHPAEVEHAMSAPDYDRLSGSAPGLLEAILEDQRLYEIAKDDVDQQVVIERYRDKGIFRVMGLQGASTALSSAAGLVGLGGTMAKDAEIEAGMPSYLDPVNPQNSDQRITAKLKDAETLLDQITSSPNAQAELRKWGLEGFDLTDQSSRPLITGMLARKMARDQYQLEMEPVRKEATKESTALWRDMNANAEALQPVVDPWSVESVVSATTNFAVQRLMMMAGAAMGGLLGGPVGAMAGGAMSFVPPILGNEYMLGREKGLDASEALLDAAGYAAAEYFPEQLGLEAMSKAIKSTGPLLRAAWQSAIANTGEEALTTILRQIYQAIREGKVDGVDPSKPYAEQVVQLLERQLQDAAAGLFGGFGMTATGGAVYRAANNALDWKTGDNWRLREKLKDTREFAARSAGVVEAIKGSKVFQRSPVAQTAILEKMAKNTNETVTFTPAKMIESGMTLEQVQAILPSVAPEALQQAIQTGSSVEVNYNAMLTQLASSDDQTLTQSALRHMQEDVTTGSIYMAEKDYQEGAPNSAYAMQKRMVDAMFEEALKSTERKEKFRSYRNTLQADKIEQLVAAGMSREAAEPAALQWATGMAVLALEASLDPVEYARTRVGTVRRADSEEQMFEMEGAGSPRLDTRGQSPSFIGPQVSDTATGESRREVRNITRPGYRTSVSTVAEKLMPVDVGRSVIRTPQDAAGVGRLIQRDAQETLLVLGTDIDGNPVSVLRHTTGKRDSSQVDVGSIAGWAQRDPNIDRIWLVHNHPSGTPELSYADQAVTQQVSELLRGTGIEVQGIIAVTDAGDYSSAGQGGTETGRISDEMEKKRVKLVERKFKEVGVLDDTQITRPDDIPVLMERIAPGQDGILLLNSQRYAVGFVPMSMMSASSLRGTQTHKALIEAMDESNSTSSIIYSRTEISDEEIDNIGTLLHMAGSPVLDAHVGGFSELAARGRDARIGETFFQGDGDEYEITPIGDAETVEVDGVTRPALNSEGRTIHSTVEGVRNFWRWFGDSKVVDEKGRPIVVYHGSPDMRFMAEDAVFKGIGERFGVSDSKGGSFWFADSRRVAGTYADDVRALDYQNSEPGVIAAYLRILNPISIDAGGARWTDAQKTQDGIHSSPIDQAKANGNDGVIIKRVRDHYQSNDGVKPATTFTVFDSRSIKSATSNSGEFSRSNPSILHQRSSAGLTEIDVDGVMRPALNSNGQLIHPTQEGIRNFWRWFGDSKAVDEQGRPKVLYHGTNKDFDEFRGLKYHNDQSQRDKTWAMLSDSPVYAGFFVGRGYSHVGGARAIMPVYARMSRPLDLRSISVGETGAREKLKKLLKSNGVEFSNKNIATGYKGAYSIIHFSVAGMGLRSRIVEAGFDGVIVNDQYDARQEQYRGSSGDGYGANNPDISMVAATTYALLDSTNIKSATGNSGAFDPNNPSILHQSELAADASWTEERLASVLNVYANHAHENESYAYVAWVNPNDFFRATTNKSFSGDIQAETRPLDVDRIRSEPRHLFLSIRKDGDSAKDFTITNHDGRHRMVALARAGVSRVPVVIRDVDHGWKEREVLHGVKLHGQSFTSGDGRGFREKLTLIPLSYSNEEAIRAEFVNAPVQRQGADNTVMFQPASVTSPDAFGKNPLFDVNAIKTNGLALARLHLPSMVKNAVAASRIKSIPAPLASRMQAAYDAAVEEERQITASKSKTKADDKARLWERVAREMDADINAVINVMRDNIRDIVSAMRSDIVERARHWYNGAHGIAVDIASRYGTTVEQAAAVLAALSPLYGWNENVSLAHRIASIWKMQPGWEDAMAATADAMPEKLQYLVAEVRGKNLSDLETDMQRGMWIRLWDETFNVKQFYVVSPEGGALDLVRNLDGTPSDFTWPFPSSAANAVAVLRDPGEIDRAIGKNHKVRNFFNNILTPDSTNNYLTIDSHAAGAAALYPVSGKNPESTATQGSDATMQSSDASNIASFGYYNIVAEAYLRAAQDLGWMPREVQSVSWEGVRGLFDNKKIRAAAIEAWAMSQSREDTIQQIASLAAGRHADGLADAITPPEWDGKFSDSKTFFTGRSFVASSNVAPPAAHADIMLEVAPDPNNALMVDIWSVIPQGRKMQITDVVGGAASISALQLSHVEGMAETRGLGAYKGQTNPSVVVHVDNMSRAVSVAKLLGNALDQDSMFVLSDEPFADAVETEIVSINVGDITNNDAVALYSRFSDIIDGFNLTDGVMTIALPPGTSGADIAAQITERAGKLDISVHSAFVRFIDKTEYKDADESETAENPEITSALQHSDELKDATQQQLAAEIAAEARSIRERSAALSQGNNAAFFPQSRNTYLLPTANLSSFLHETGHLFWEVMIEFAHQPNVSDRLRRDVTTTLRWMGLKGDSLEALLLAYDQLDADERTKLHERWAETYEQYLLEGSSPSLEMEGAFRTFRQWLTRVYSSVLDSLNSRDMESTIADFKTKRRRAALNREMREVMSHILATDDQIKEAEMSRAVAGMFTERQPGMTDEQWQEYLDANELARGRSVASLIAKKLKDMKLERTKARMLRSKNKQAEAARAAAEAEARERVMSQPVNVARELLTKPIEEGGMRIDYEDIRKVRSQSLNLIPYDRISSATIQKHIDLRSNEAARRFIEEYQSGELARHVINGEEVVVRLDPLADSVYVTAPASAIPGLTALADQHQILLRSGDRHEGFVEDTDRHHGYMREPQEPTRPVEQTVSQPMDQRPDDMVLFQPDSYKKIKNREMDARIEKHFGAKLVNTLSDVKQGAPAIVKIFHGTREGIFDSIRSEMLNEDAFFGSDSYDLSNTYTGEKRAPIIKNARVVRTYDDAVAVIEDGGGKVTRTRLVRLGEQWGDHLSALVPDARFSSLPHAELMSMIALGLDVNQVYFTAKKRQWLMEPEDPTKKEAAEIVSIKNDADLLLLELHKAMGYFGDAYIMDEAATVLSPDFLEAYGRLPVEKARRLIKEARPSLSDFAARRIAIPSKTNGDPATRKPQRRNEGVSLKIGRETISAYISYGGKEPDVRRFDAELETKDFISFASLYAAGVDSGGVVMPWYVYTKNPMVVDAKMSSWMDIEVEVRPTTANMLEIKKRANELIGDFYSDFFAGWTVRDLIARKGTAGHLGSISVFSDDSLGEIGPLGVNTSYVMSIELKNKNSKVWIGVMMRPRFTVSNAPLSFEFAEIKSSVSLGDDIKSALPTIKKEVSAWANGADHPGMIVSMNTRALSRYARMMGHDAVIVKNVFDSGGGDYREAESIIAVNGNGTNNIKPAFIDAFYQSSAEWGVFDTPVDEAMGDRAREYFGLTFNPKLAGYIMPNGDMLDLSGRHMTSKDNWPYMTDRATDHRDLHGESLRAPGVSIGLESSGTDGMIEFMHKTGAVRWHHSDGFTAVSAVRMPTAEQLKVLVMYGKDAALEKMDLHGNTVDDIEEASRAQLKHWWRTSSPLYQPAYHGTPYDFDEFSLSHMGKGEGAQAYGWGLYFAGSKSVAEWYRAKLSEEIEPTVVAKVKKEGWATISTDQLMERLETGAVVNALAHALDNASFVQEGHLDSFVRERMKLVIFNADARLQNKGLTAEQKAEEKKIKAEARKVMADFYFDAVREKGQLYKVDIPEDDTYLLWDKPLSEQSDYIKNQIDSAGYDWNDADKGEDFYKLLSRELGSDEAASKQLNEWQGISGIKYLDGSSRSKGKGNYNYVIFDDKAVKVLEKYYQESGDDEIKPPSLDDYAAPDGDPLADVARRVGLTPDDLIDQLQHAPTAGEEIQRVTDEIMTTRYSELATPQDIEDAVNEALYNTMREKVMSTELSVMARAMGSPTVIQRAARVFAENRVGDTAIIDLDPRAHDVAAAAAGRAAMDAFTSGKPVEAAVQKRNQLIHAVMARLSRKARDESEKIVRRLRKAADGTASVDPDYQDRIDALLEQYELVRVTNKEVRDRQSMAGWMEAHKDEPIAIPQSVIDKDGVTNYRSLTVNELRDLDDAVRHLAHLGRLKKKLLNARDKRDLDEIVDEGIKSVLDNNEERPDVYERPGLISKLLYGIEKVRAVHLKFATLMRELDGWKDDGFMWNRFVRPANDAATSETVRNKKSSEELTAVFDMLRGDNLKEMAYINQMSMSLSLEARLTAALHWGNESSRQRVLEGFNWDLAVVNEILGTLTAKQLEFVNAVWRHLDSYKPDIAAQEERLGGVEPEWIEAAPWEQKSKDGVIVKMRGGYMPAKYNSESSVRALNNEAKSAIEGDMKAVRGRARANKGHLEQRKAHGAGGLRLDFGIISSHIRAVNHRLAWEDFLQDTQKMLNHRDEDLMKAIRATAGAPVVEEIRAAIKDMANPDPGAAHILEAALNHLRNGSTVAGLAWRATTAMMQFTGLSQSVSRLGVSTMMSGMAQFYGPSARMEEVIQRVYAMSPFMENRGSTQSREVNDVINQLRDEKMSALKASFFWMIQKAQLMVDMPTWLGAYEQALKETGDEAKAVALADQAVIDTQGDGTVNNLARVQRGHPAWKLFTNFYSYFSTTFQLSVEAYERADLHTPEGYLNLMTDWVLLYLIPSVAVSFLHGAIMGDDDEDELKERMFDDLIAYHFGTMILVREFAGAATGGRFGYEGTAGQRLMSEAQKVARSVEAGRYGRVFWRSLNNTLGILFHYPSGQINNTVEGAFLLAEGKTDNPLALINGKK